MSESNKMKEMPVNKLMIWMGIPMILSMALQAVYNIVDSAFVGNMKVGSEAALNALTRACSRHSGICVVKENSEKALIKNRAILFIKANKTYSCEMYKQKII